MTGAGDSILTELREIGEKPPDRASRAEKKNYSERLSRVLAQKFADALRGSFPGVTPDAQGRGHESQARTAKGFKKLDVNYSTPELGLGLGISIKTINFKDPSNLRYTKNVTRVDNELRAEAKDYHDRQPWSVLVAVLFLPGDACDDGGKTAAAASSFGAAVRHFRMRANRQNPRNEEELFERMFIGLYEGQGEAAGECLFFDVMDAPPRAGRPAAACLISFGQLIREIRSTYDSRNFPPFHWAGEDKPST